MLNSSIQPMSQMSPSCLCYFFLMTWIYILGLYRFSAFVSVENLMHSASISQMTLAPILSSKAFLAPSCKHYSCQLNEDLDTPMACFAQVSFAKGSHV